MINSPEEKSPRICSIEEIYARAPRIEPPTNLMTETMGTKRVVSSPTCPSLSPPREEPSSSYWTCASGTPSPASPSNGNLDLCGSPSREHENVIFEIRKSIEERVAELATADNIEFSNENAHIFSQRVHSGSSNTTFLQSVLDGLNTQGSDFEAFRLAKKRPGYQNLLNPIAHLNPWSFWIFSRLSPLS